MPVNRKTIVFLALPGVQSLDVAGPMEVFALAGEASQEGPGYELLLGSTAAGPIRTHAGFEIGPALELESLPRSIDTLIVAGGDEAAMRAAAEGPLLPWLRARAAQCRRTASICTGAYLLGAAGLLDGRRVATHWNACADLASLFPAAQVETNAIFVADPPIYSSAGVSAGIDLCLALVEADLGAPVARAVARELVLYLRRPGGQSQFSDGMDLQFSGASPLADLARRILEDPRGDLSVPRLAQTVGMSERNFSRRFRQSVGRAPAQFVEAARVERAKTLLESSQWPLARVAERAGFGSVDGLFRAFGKALGVTPAEYRARFGAASQPDRR